MAIKNPGILILVLCTVFFGQVFDFFQSIYVEIEPSFDPEWVFGVLPDLLLELFQKHGLIIGIGYFLFYLFGSITNTIIFSQLAEIYRERDAKLLTVVRSISLQTFLRFAAVQLVVDLFFNTMLVAFFALGCYLYLSMGISILIPLFILWLLTFPIHFILIGFFSMLAVLPISYRKFLSKAQYLLVPKSGLKLYLVHVLMFWTKAGMVTLIVWFFGTVLEIPRMIPIAIAIGLTILFSVFKGTSYSLRLDILKKDHDFQTTFPAYFKKSET